jgi:hypothetical protein
MSNLLVKAALPLCAILVFSAGAAAQLTAKAQSARSAGSNPAVVIVSSAAKGTWAVTSFTAKAIGKPVAKTLLMKATPAVSKFVLKNAAKEALPFLLKLSVL